MTKVDIAQTLQNIRFQATSEYPMKLIDVPLFFGQSKNVESIHVHNAILSASSFEALANNVTALTSLTELSFDCVTATFPATLLSTFMSLRILSLRCRGGTSDARKIALPLSLPSLERLELQCIEVTAYGEYPNLRHLAVAGYCGMGSRLQALIGSCASSLKSIEFNLVIVEMSNGFPSLSCKDLLEPLKRLYPRIMERVDPSCNSYDDTFKLDLTAL